MKKWGTVFEGLRVPPRAHIAAHAMFYCLESRPATETEIIEHCMRMAQEGQHDLDMGYNSNLRNCFQRSSIGSTIYKEKWHRRYAVIFERLPGSPARWQLVKGFKP